MSNQIVTISLMPYHRDMNKEYGSYSTEPIYVRWNPFIQKTQFWSESNGAWHDTEVYHTKVSSDIELRYEDTWCEPDFNLTGAPESYINPLT